MAGRYKEDIEKLDQPFNLESFGSVNYLDLADYFLKVKDSLVSLDQIQAEDARASTNRGPQCRLTLMTSWYLKGP